MVKYLNAQYGKHIEGEVTLGPDSSKDMPERKRGRPRKNPLSVQITQPVSLPAPVPKVNLRDIKRELVALEESTASLFKNLSELYALQSKQMETLLSNESRRQTLLGLVS